MPSGPNTGPGKKNTGAKSSKAIQAARKKSGGVPGSLSKQRQVPWLMIGGVAVVVLLIAVIGVSIFPKFQEQQDRTAAQQDVEEWVPSESNQDPALAIDGVTFVEYPQGVHVSPTDRVAYDYTPPFGGPHDAIWATCTGTVYENPVRTENMVHSLEHGAVWITYNPELVDEATVQALALRVDGRTYMMMSPYPGQDSPISLQSWGHQLQVDNADDERIDQFITALRLNRYTYPEVGASCGTIPGSFDPADPPAFDPSEPGPDAVPMEQDATGEGVVVPENMQEPAGS